MGGEDGKNLKSYTGDEMKLLSVVSARPNFVKLAALHHSLRSGAGQAIEHVIIHTGQHYDPLFSDIFFEQLEIPKPSHNLGVHGGDREDVVSTTEEALTPLLKQLTPDVVLVYGDVNGALGAARAAKRVGIRLAHVEAGLRSFDQSMPEELNRIAVDAVADLLFCSEQSGMDNLSREGVSGEAHLVGNTMIDTLIRMMPRIEHAPPLVDAEIGKHFAIATLHRPSNVDTPDAFKRNVDFLEEISKNIRLLLPLHHRARIALEKFNISMPRNIIEMSPLPYLLFLRLMKEAQFIITDSGGIQEEAVFLQKRCFTLRKNTERPSTVESGSNVLVDITKTEDRESVLRFASEPELPTITIPPLWDGKTGERIIDRFIGGALR
jgi:UDP-N-acetylglucosamine 2-epimerase (non-hydrolysing)